MEPLLARPPTGSVSQLACREEFACGDGRPSRYQQGPSQIDTLFVVDVGVRTIVVDMVSNPDIAASDQAELDGMLASLELN